MVSSSALTRSKLVLFVQQVADVGPIRPQMQVPFQDFVQRAQIYRMRTRRGACSHTNYHFACAMALFTPASTPVPLVTRVCYQGAILLDSILQLRIIQTYAFMKFKLFKLTNWSFGALACTRHSPENAVAQHVVLFSHANAVDCGSIMWFLHIFQRKIRCNIFCYDYTGTFTLS